MKGFFEKNWGLNSKKNGYLELSLLYMEKKKFKLSQEDFQIYIQLIKLIPRERKRERNEIHCFIFILIH